MTDSTILSAFPWPILDRIIGMPSYKTLSKMNIQLNANSASVLPTIYPMGLIGLMVLASTYQILTGAPWIPPPNPRQVPVIGPLASSAQIAATTNVFKQAWETYKTVLLTDKILKKQVLEAVEEWFY